MTATSKKNSDGFIGINMGNGIIQSFGGTLTFSSTPNQPKNPYWPTKVIHNDHTVIVYFENGDKRVVTCSVEDDFNMEFGFLLALAHEVFGSKDKYRQMYTKKVDKKAYPKMKNNQKEIKIVSDLKLSETKFTEKQLEEMKEIIEKSASKKNKFIGV